jgi:hypothetical protein
VGAHFYSVDELNELGLELTNASYVASQIENKAIRRLGANWAKKLKESDEVVDVKYSGENDNFVFFNIIGTPLDSAIRKDNSEFMLQEFYKETTFKAKVVEVDEFVGKINIEFVFS